MQYSVEWAGKTCSSWNLPSVQYFVSLSDNVMGIFPKKCIHYNVFYIVMLDNVS